MWTKNLFIQFSIPWLKNLNKIHRPICSCSNEETVAKARHFTKSFCTFLDITRVLRICRNIWPRDSWKSWFCLPRTRPVKMSHTKLSTHKISSVQFELKGHQKKRIISGSCELFHWEQKIPIYHRIGKMKIKIVYWLNEYRHTFCQLIADIQSLQWVESYMK